MNWRKPLIFALLYLTGSKIPRVLKEIELTNNLSESKKKKYQQDKLKKLLLHSYNNVPYYNRVLSEAKVVVKGKVNLNRFNKIPILTKEIIRTEGANLYSKDYKTRKHYANTSGGSTGEPVKFIQDKLYDEWNIATKIYYNKILGKFPGDPELKLWGCDTDIIYGGLDLKTRIINFLYNRKFFNCYKFSEIDIKKLLELHESFKPKVYWTYMEAAVELAKYIYKNNILITPPKYIISTIGPLSKESRKLIKNNLHCPVYNQYGSREVGWISAEILKEMDVFFWHNLVELNTTNRKEGEVLVTSLNNFSMPLIRYNIGDVAGKGNKSYKTKGVKSYLTLKEIKGRTLGFFKKKDGSLVHSHFFVQQFFNREWIKRFKIIQRNYGLMECIIEGKENKKDMKVIEGLFEKLIGKCKVKWKFVKKIPPLKNGKYIYTLCEVE